MKMSLIPLMVTLFFRLNFVQILLISVAFLIFINKVIVLLITLVKSSCVDGECFSIHQLYSLS